MNDRQKINKLIICFSEERAKILQERGYKTYVPKSAGITYDCICYDEFCDCDIESLQKMLEFYRRG